MLKPAAQAAHEAQRNPAGANIGASAIPTSPTDTHMLPATSSQNSPVPSAMKPAGICNIADAPLKVARSSPTCQNAKPHIALDQRQYREQQRKMQIAPNVHHRTEVQRAPRARSPRNVITRNARNSHNIINILKHNAADYTTIAQPKFSANRRLALRLVRRQADFAAAPIIKRYNNGAVEVGEVEAKVRSSAANRDCAMAYPKQSQRGQLLSLPQTDVRECRIDTGDKGTGGYEI